MKTLRLAKAVLAGTGDPRSPIGRRLCPAGRDAAPRREQRSERGRFRQWLRTQDVRRRNLGQSWLRAVVDLRACAPMSRILLRPAPSRGCADLRRNLQRAGQRCALHSLDDVLGGNLREHSRQRSHPTNSALPL